MKKPSRSNLIPKRPKGVDGIKDLSGHVNLHGQMMPDVVGSLVRAAQEGPGRGCDPHSASSLEEMPKSGGFGIEGFGAKLKFSHS